MKHLGMAVKVLAGLVGGGLAFGVLLTMMWWPIDLMSETRVRGRARVDMMRWLKHNHPGEQPYNLPSVEWSEGLPVYGRIITVRREYVLSCVPTRVRDAPRGCTLLREHVIGGP